MPSSCGSWSVMDGDDCGLSRPPADARTWALPRAPGSGGALACHQHVLLKSPFCDTMFSFSPLFQ